eukprot:scaffold625_cov202-Alexandrium_tamarense.AAC.16
MLERTTVGRSREVEVERAMRRRVVADVHIMLMFVDSAVIFRNVSYQASGRLEERQEAGVIRSDVLRETTPTRAAAARGRTL